MTKLELLCNRKLSVYRSAMTKDSLNEFQARLREAIENSTPSQTAIAKFCDVTVQSVGGWKRTGQISKENLKKLSEVSGYRYLWLLKGEGHKLFKSEEENRREMGMIEHGLEYTFSQLSPAADTLLKSLKLALANGCLSEESLTHLASFLNSLAGNSKPKD